MADYNHLEEADRRIISKLSEETEEGERVRKTTKQLSEELDDITKGWISKRLNILHKEKKFLEKEREGKNVFYSLSDEYNNILQKIATREREAEFIQKTSPDRIAEIRLYNTLLKKPYGSATTYGLPHNKLDLEEIEVSQDDLNGKENARELLEVVLGKINEEASGILCSELEDEYKKLADENFRNTDDRDSISNIKQDLIEALWENTFFTSRKLKFEVDDDRPLKQFTADGLDKEVLRILLPMKTPSFQENEDLENFLQELEDTVREKKKFQMVLRNFY